MSYTHAVATVRPARRVLGTVTLPGDKSISHRYAILAALAHGETTLGRFAPGADCASTLSCLEQLGVRVFRDERTVRIHGRGLRGLGPTAAALDCGNSGTTMRILSGVLAAHAFETTLTGDASLRRRPMRRVAVPLERMGAVVVATNGCPPLTITGGSLRGIDFAPEIPSAQVKSAVLLAGLQADGLTTVTEPAVTRDHTERALRAFGAHVVTNGPCVSLAGGQPLTAGSFDVPGDVSSAVFWAVAAAALPGSRVELAGVGLNPSRTAVFGVLARAGARVETEPGSVSAEEPVGTVIVSHRDLRPIEIAPAEVPALIDELPALAAFATLGAGLVVTGAGELRAKESDRIASLVRGLRALGADADELGDGFVIRPRLLRGGTADACDDHRLAMAFAIAALGAQGPSTITGAAAVGVSYPGFFEQLELLRG